MVSLTLLLLFLLVSGPESGTIFLTWVMVSVKACSEVEPWRDEQAVKAETWKTEDGEGGGR